MIKTGTINRKMIDKDVYLSTDGMSSSVSYVMNTEHL